MLHPVFVIALSILALGIDEMEGYVMNLRPCSPRVHEHLETPCEQQRK